MNKKIAIALSLMFVLSGVLFTSFSFAQSEGQVCRGYGDRTCGLTLYCTTAAGSSGGNGKFTCQKSFLWSFKKSQNLSNGNVGPFPRSTPGGDQKPKPSVCKSKFERCRREAERTFGTCRKRAVTDNQIKQCREDYGDASKKCKKDYDDCLAKTVKTPKPKPKS